MLTGAILGGIIVFLLVALFIVFHSYKSLSADLTDQKTNYERQIIALTKVNTVEAEQVAVELQAKQPINITFYASDEQLCMMAYRIAEQVKLLMREPS
jgi:hypothetical protein